MEFRRNHRNRNDRVDGYIWLYTGFFDRSFSTNYFDEFGV